MQFKPYKELVAMSKEKLGEAMAPIRAQMVKSKAHLEMAKLDDEILTKQTSMQELFAKKDVDFAALMDSIDDVELLERRRGKYVEVLSQLFPDDK
jgi:hypothetical protein